MERTEDRPGDFWNLLGLKIETITRAELADIEMRFLEPGELITAWVELEE